MNETIHSTKKPLTGEISVPGDKSISHRAVLFASLAEGKSTIRGFLRGEDCLSTIDCMRKLGITIIEDEDEIIVEGKGLTGLSEPTETLDVGNSGTTIRLLSGILAGQPFSSILVGDESIAKRPMARVTVPLKSMGAKIDGRKEGNFTPLHIRGGGLHGISFESPVASAQVKSSILLAGLYADGETTVHEPHKSRDHTERMLKSFGVEVETTALTAKVSGGNNLLKGTEISVPGDISSAAFLLVAAAIVKDSNITITNVGMNPTRTGIIDVLQAMNADLTIKNERFLGAEPIADLQLKYRPLQAMTIDGALIPRLIDEIPAIAILATQAEGKTVIKDAEELKVKETNRIDTVVNQLKELGADLEATDDGMIIHGKATINGGEVKSYGDHRIGMSMALCGLISDQPVTVLDTEAIDVSYPNFFEDLKKLSSL